MNLEEILVKFNQVSDALLDCLDANSLLNLSACTRKCREVINSPNLWRKRCKIKGYEKYLYLNDEAHHSLIPTKTTSVSPIFTELECETLEKLNDWRLCYNRAEHLIKNWRNGVYFVAPILKGHKGRISAFDSDGVRIASGSRDEKLIKIWSVDECDCLNTIKLKTDSINCLKIYNELVLVAGEDGIVRIFDQTEGDLINTLAAKYSLQNSPITKFIIVDHKLFVLHSDNTIRVWSLKDYELKCVLRGHNDEIECLNYYNSFLVSGSWDKSLFLWNLNTGSKLAKLVGHSEAVTCVKMKENVIVSGSSDSTLRIWNLEMNKETNSQKNDEIKIISEPRVLVGHESDIYCVEAFGDFIVSGGADSMVIVWDFNGEKLHKLSGHLGIVRFLFIDEFKLVSGGDAKKILIWDYKEGNLLNTLHRNPNKLNFMWVNDTKIITASPETNSNITIISYW